MTTTPLRVLIKGQSTVGWVSFMGGPRSDLTYPRVLEQSVTASGRAIEVWDTSMVSEPTTRALRHWQRQVARFDPDVVLLHYGVYETYHLVLPQWLETHAHSLSNRPGRWRDAYRRLLLVPGWKVATRVQRTVDRMTPAALGARRAEPIAADLETLVRRIRSVGSPLVLVMAPHPPGAPYRRWFPGALGRTAAVHAALAAMVARVADPDVRLVDTAVLLAPLVEASIDPVPDGGHFAPAAHRAVGEALADVVTTWDRTRVPVGAR